MIAVVRAVGGARLSLQTILFLVDKAREYVLRSIYKELRMRAGWGRGEGVEGSRRRLGDIITAVSCCRGWMSQKTMPSGGKVDDTHAPD